MFAVGFLVLEVFLVGFWLLRFRALLLAFGDLGISILRRVAISASSQPHRLLKTTLWCCFSSPKKAALCCYPKSSKFHQLIAFSNLKTSSRRCLPSAPKQTSHQTRRAKKIEPVKPTGKSTSNPLEKNYKSKKNWQKPLQVAIQPLFVPSYAVLQCALPAQSFELDDDLLAGPRHPLTGKTCCSLLGGANEVSGQKRNTLGLCLVLEFIAANMDPKHLSLQNHFEALLQPSSRHLQCRAQFCSSKPLMTGKMLENVLFFDSARIGFKPFLEDFPQAHWALVRGI